MIKILIILGLCQIYNWTLKQRGGLKAKGLKFFEEEVSVGRLRCVLEEAFDEAMTEIDLGEVDLGLRLILSA
ncbi:hypothetical protein [Bartonella sp. MR30HLJHH]|uniref:hypothetical protein n=1 Tax=Bartonella sp. MR30HLJHH TaxID=3243557 RepID=UPI0035CE8F7D